MTKLILRRQLKQPTPRAPTYARVKLGQLKAGTVFNAPNMRGCITERREGRLIIFSHAELFYRFPDTALVQVLSGTEITERYAS